ncbi:hypothetical protein OH77DRAFT_1419032 [Trametes cingulata]|nr:hypothetical protein OH77DRAFT_1419032 [Trametes cingulata]
MVQHLFESGGRLWTLRNPRIWATIQRYNGPCKSPWEPARLGVRCRQLSTEGGQQRVSHIPPLKHDNRAQPRALRMKLNTLDPRRLASRDFVDVSGKTGFVVDRKAKGTPSLKDGTLSNINYDRRRFRTEDGEHVFHDMPFPANTHGYVYYRARPHAEVAGSLRFRVTQGRDPQFFQHGEDLLTVYGSPWQIPLVAIATSARCVVLRKMLEEDGLVTPEALEQCKRLAPTADPILISPQTQIVGEVGDPFHVNLRSPRGRTLIAGDNSFYHLLRKDVFLSNLRMYADWPYESGVLVCQLEFFGDVSPSIGLRILSIAQPVRLRTGMPEDPSMYTVDEPREGELLSLAGVPLPIFNNKRGTAGGAIHAILVRRNFLRLQASEEDLESTREARRLHHPGQEDERDSISIATWHNNHTSS